MSSKSTVKNQHYIPRHIVKRFSFLKSQSEWNSSYYSNYITLNWRAKWSFWKNKSISTIFKDDFTYESDFLKPNTLENFFKQIENRLDPVVEDIVFSIKELEKWEWSLFEIKKKVEKCLVDFLIYYYRSWASLTELWFSTKENKNLKIFELLQKILNNGYLKSLAKTIKHWYDFCLIKNNEDFLISDNFISTWSINCKFYLLNFSNRFIWLKDTLILIPLSSKYYIAYFNTSNSFFLQKNKINFLSTKESKLINKLIINNSYERCVWKDVELLEKYSSTFSEQSPGAIYSDKFWATIWKEVFLYKNDKLLYDSFMFFGAIDNRYEKLGKRDFCLCWSWKMFWKCHNPVFDKQNIIHENFWKITGNPYYFHINPSLKVEALPTKLIY